MNNFINWKSQLKDDAEMYKKVLVDEAMSLPTPSKSIQFLKEQRNKYDTAGFAGTTDDAISRLINNVIDDAIQVVTQKMRNQKWRN